MGRSNNCKLKTINLKLPIHFIDILCMNNVHSDSMLYVSYTTFSFFSQNIRYRCTFSNIFSVTIFTSPYQIVTTLSVHLVKQVGNELHTHDLPKILNLACSYMKSPTCRLFKSLSYLANSHI